MSDNAAIRSHLSTLLTAKRAEQFYGWRPENASSSGNLSGAKHHHLAQGIMKSIYLQSLHAALATQRAAWSALQTLQMMLEEDFQQQFGDEATAYVGMLTADPPGGSIENITHEHVSKLLSLMERVEQPKLQSEPVKPE